MAAKVKKTKEERKAIVKKVLKGFGIALSVVIGIAAVLVSAYVGVKYTQGPGNQLDAPGSDVTSHNISQDGPTGQTGIDVRGQDGGVKGDNYYEENVEIKDNEDQEYNPYYRVDTEDEYESEDDDEMTK